ncbi:YIP1 family protein [Clostridium sp. 19966]|uniref:Yip1 family protein n=1 Tax=Clostridium sp. 19966 TaxID=2768166 RepID=UPI0028DEC576|nr:Yip1 family protein [Clostridium sp. 19966]MDT8718975.1 YIP1 family protein [Clostridium sp. 19966]
MENNRKNNLSAIYDIKELFIKPRNLYEKYKNTKIHYIFFIVLILLSFISGIMNYIWQDEKAVSDIVKSSQGSDMLNEVMNTGKSLGGAVQTGMIAIFVIMLKVLFVALIYYIIVKMVDKKGNYKKIIGICSLSYIVYTLGSIIIELLDGITKQAFTSFSSGYSGIFLSNLNPFNIWSVFLMYLGLKICFDMKHNKALISVIALVVLKILANLAWYSIRS